MSADVLPSGVTTIEQSAKLLSVADELIRDAQTPEEAEELLRSTRTVEFVSSLQRLGEAQVKAWQRMTLRAMRRKGELLGEAHPTAGTGRGNKKSVTGGNAFTGAERKAANTARKIAAVPVEDFDLYLLTATRPSITGLLEKICPPKKPGKPKPELAPEEDLIKACLAGIRRKKTRIDIGRKLGMNKDTVALATAYAVAWDRHHHPRIGSWTGKTNTKRASELEAMRNGDYAKLVEWQLRFSKMCALLETVDLNGFGLDTINMWKIADIYDDLITLGEWHDRTLSAVQRWLNDINVREKITKLRDTSGRTPEEADTALRLADRLENKLERREVT
jgi:hypothetical protein